MSYVCQLFLSEILACFHDMVFCLLLRIYYQVALGIHVLEPMFANPVSNRAPVAFFALVFNVIYLLILIKFHFSWEVFCLINEKIYPRSNKIVPRAIAFKMGCG